MKRAVVVPEDERWFYIRSRLYGPEFRQLRQEAAARRVSISACVADCLQEYFALRVEMATAITAPGKPGEPHTGIVHSIAARSEQRLAATIDARSTEILDGISLVRRLVVRLAQLFLVHTPEVDQERHAAAVASATRRFASYRQAVDDDGDAERLAQAGITSR